MRLTTLLPFALLLGCAEPRLTAEQMYSSPPKRLALASAAPHRWVSVLGVNIAVHDSDPDSQKPVIFCLHAIGHGSSDYAAFEARFKAAYRIIAFDWPGQGASGDDTEAASAQRYAALFAALVDQLNVKSVIILGNSIGGSVAVRYAAAYPDNVRALMLADSAGFDSNPAGILPGLFISHIERKMRTGVAGDPQFGKWFRDYYADILIAPAARSQRDAIVASAYEIAPVLAQAWASFKQSDADIRALARELRVPVFVGWARDDRVIRWSRNRSAIEKIPNVEIHLFEGGHAAFLESPDAFNAAAARFLHKVEGQ
jgi:4,5:9,10-diseco-3-hydroxy-5,9,17-trioxoandrosta-1(10),2-diene-4-oate hydrolase